MREEIQTCKQEFLPAKMKSGPFSTPKCSHSCNPTSGFPIETRTNCTPFARSSPLLFAYWRICSWQNGHPNDLVRTTNETPFLLGNRLDTEIGVPSSFNTDDCSMASRGLMARAACEGAPEIFAEFPHPQSVVSVEKSWVL